jgi:penicillin-binding protein 1B
VKVAETIGYDEVAATARAAGLNVNIKPTPSIALGSYEVMPLEIADAYTVFVNNGQLVKTNMLKAIRASDGVKMYQSKIEKKEALDPRVAYLVQNMMQEVLRTGTGAGVGRYGFNIGKFPAAGKTGTSEKDGWFVGFTSRIICAVWVGFDDNRDFVLEGAHSSLPIWADFMARAHQHREYQNVHALPAPDGVETVEIDADTGQLATAACPRVRTEVFIAGTQPVEVCRMHGGKGGTTTISSWDTPGPTTVAQAGSTPREDVDDPPPSRPRSRPAPATAAPQSKQQTKQAAPAQPEKKSLGERILGWFK